VRLVSVAHAYPRWDGDVAGAFIERLCVALNDRSHSVVVVVPADEGKGGRIVRNNLDVRSVRYAPASRETLAYRGHMADAGKSLLGLLPVASMIASQAGAVFEEVRNSRADLVHAHWWVPGGVSAWLACIAAHRPFVVTMHGTDVAILKRSEPARRLARLVLRKASVVTAVSSYLAREAALVSGLDFDQIIVQPMPLEVDRYSRQSRGGEGVVTVGRLVQQKNVSVLLEAIAVLNKQDKTIRLKVVGDGPERRSLEYRATQLGIANVTQFVGAVPPETIPDAIGDADVFAFPAINEGLGLAAAEAFMLGVPVVAARQGGGVTDIVPPEGAGRLVDATDPNKMAQAIEELLGDAESKQLASERGRNLKQHLSPDAVAAIFEGVYERALAND
jgi:glycosyltransferase involved in cell wall biosynthesis